MPGMGAGEQQSSRPRGCGSAGFSLGCLHECVWGWACPRDIPELFWEAANLAGSSFSRSSRYVGISDETICLRSRRAKPSQARGMCHFEHSCGKSITQSLSAGQAQQGAGHSWLPALCGSRLSFQVEGSLAHNDLKNLTKQLIDGETEAPP